MEEIKAREVLTTLLGGILVPHGPTIDRAIQTAKQIGSAWPTKNIELVNLYFPDAEEFRIIIQ